MTPGLHSATCHRRPTFPTEADPHRTHTDTGTPGDLPAALWAADAGRAPGAVPLLPPLQVAGGQGPLGVSCRGCLGCCGRGRGLGASCDGALSLPPLQVAEGQKPLGVSCLGCLGCDSGCSWRGRSWGAGIQFSCACCPFRLVSDHQAPCDALDSPPPLPGPQVPAGALLRAVCAGGARLLQRADRGACACGCCVWRPQRMPACLPFLILSKVSSGLMLVTDSCRPR